jgi:hypothetical protein
LNPFAEIWGPRRLPGYEGERLISAATVEGSLPSDAYELPAASCVLEVLEQYLTSACRTK